MRGTALRALAGVCAASWIVLPGFGAIDLAVTWSPDWPQVLEAGWGLFFTAVVGAAFVLTAVRPRAYRPGVLQLVVAIVALVVSTVVADETRLVWFAAGLALQTVIVYALARRVWRDAAPARVSGSGVSASLLLLAAVAVVPWLAYALDMWALNRQRLGDRDLTIGVDHYSVQGALGLALVLLPLLAALRSEVRPFTPVCAGAAGAYLGLVSLAWPGAEGGFGRWWSAAAIVWGLALTAAALLPALSGRLARPRQARSDGQLRRDRNP